MKPILLMFLAVAVLAAVPVHAGMHKMPLLVPDTDCTAPEVASDPDGLTMVAYTARGVLLQSFVVVQPMGTRAACADYVGEPRTIASGSQKKICWTREGFVLAVADGSVIQVFESDLEGNWDTANPTMIFAASDVVGMDLWGAQSDAAGPHVFLTYQIWNNPPHGDYEVHYAAGTASGWSTPEAVATGLTVAPNPQITWTTGPAGPWPDVYWLTGPEGARDLVHSNKDLAAGWSTPVVVPGDGVSGPTPFDGSFDVVRNWLLECDILGLGPQPTCPCGSIHHQLFDGSWQPAEDVTVDYLTYDWPYSPRLAHDDLGRTYAFWMQIASGPGLDERFRTLEYRVRDMDGWQDWSTLFLDETGPRLGSNVAIAVNPAGHPVWAWTQRDSLDGVPQPEQVWVARLLGATPVGDAPAARAELTAWPNPFNPRVKLAIDASAGESVRLDIHDARGRLVTTLLDGTLAADRRELTWDGTDRTGRAAPSGVYFARLMCGEQAAEVAKLVLAR